jgi:deoxyribodipyrimidine photo-lyase
VKAIGHLVGPAVYWTRRYEPSLATRDQIISETLTKVGIEARIFASALLFEPEAIRTKTNGPYQVFTPFYRACLAGPQPRPPHVGPRQGKINGPLNWPQSNRLDDLQLVDRVKWASQFTQFWEPGMIGARVLLQQRIDTVLTEYLETRDDPNVEGTSRLSPHLHFGEISIREVWATLAARVASKETNPQARASLQGYQRQLIWREFAHHLLVNFPKTPEEPLRPAFKAFPWRKDSRSLQAWQKGRTGYPYIDAGLRQLWATGWMHNRVRMAVASFLVKDLLIPWQAGAEWFWDTLVDADLAQNTMGWQWTAGCGADAAPYFRIFHPVTQGERFDPDGDYVRRWVPELARLEGKWIQCPWEAPAEVLHRADVILGKTYPQRLVDHAQARERALSAYQTLPKAI